MMEKERNSVASSYFNAASSDRELFYDIFFRVCRKYNIEWATASSAEKSFAEEVTRVTYEHRKAVMEGRPLTSIRAAFEPETMSAG